ncbi:hypothetical protein PSE_2078 [Pseudovibrio sp. FO-BEG1]|nr:hypothetical protein PSE_2078 [Pseudovibrio sp. FO-BEG1]
MYTLGAFGDGFSADANFKTVNIASALTSKNPTTRIFLLLKIIKKDRISRN